MKVDGIEYKATVSNKSKEQKKLFETISGNFLTISKGWRYIFEAEILASEPADRTPDIFLGAETVEFQPYDEIADFVFIAIPKLIKHKRKRFESGGGHLQTQVLFTSKKLFQSLPRLTLGEPVIPVWPVMPSVPVVAMPFTNDGVFLE